VQLNAHARTHKQAALGEAGESDHFVVSEERSLLVAQQVCSSGCERRRYRGRGHLARATFVR
jgi:hypothetical protein